MKDTGTNLAAVANRKRPRKLWHLATLTVKESIVRVVVLWWSIGQSPGVLHGSEVIGRVQYEARF